MEKGKLGINTLVFLEDLRNGVEQSYILDKINSLNIKNAEIRREFIKDFDREIVEIKEKAEKYGMNLFYSVPEWLFEENKVRTKEIERYFNEAYKMNCNYVKMHIGEIDEITKENSEVIKDLCDKYKIKLTIENDQTAENGQVKKINNFLIKNRELGGNITFTFDVGNWIFQEEDPLKNAEILKEFVTYIHLKNVNSNKENVLLSEGIIQIEKILDILPKNLHTALEYPCSSLSEVEKEIEKVLKL